MKMKKYAFVQILAILLVLSQIVTSCFVSNPTGGSSGSSYPGSSAYSKTLNYEGISFVVNSSYGQLTVEPRGLQSGSTNNTIRRQIEGTAYNAEVTDLDGDGSPELLVYTRSGDNNYGHIYGFTVMNRRSMGEIYMPPLSNNPEASQGYQGRDDMGLVDGFLVRRYPIYNYGNPTGSYREVRYRMVYGENSKIFRVESVREFYGE